MTKTPAILLCNPKSPYNVGGVLRACHVFGVPDMAWTGERVLDNADMRRKAGRSVSVKAKYRLPREERLKEYGDVQWMRWPNGPDWQRLRESYTPVAVEVLDNAERLSTFIHPLNALYIFGPEDSGIAKGWFAECHRFVRIDTRARTPLNLAAAVNVVLYDRLNKGED